MFDQRPLPDWFRQRVGQETRGEKMLWAGAPEPSAAFRAGMVIWWFGVPWMVFTLFWEISVIRLWLFQLPNGKGGPPGFGLVLWGLPFVLVGLGMMGVPFYSRRMAKRTVYALTDKRLLTLTEDRNLTVQSLNLRAITATARREKPDRSGTLTVSLSPYVDSDGDKSVHQEIFYGISEVKAVETLLRDAMERVQK